MIATLDRPGLLERAVAAVLDQDYLGEIECVVVYDHVPVRELPVTAGARRSLKLVANTRTKGLAGGRNSGCAAASGDLIAFCDDDDYWQPEKIGRQVAQLQQSQGCVAVACGIRLKGPGIDQVRSGRSTPVDREELLADRTMEVNSSTILFWSSVLAEVGEVDERIPGGYGEDYDFLLRLAAVGPIAMVPEALATLSWSGQSVFFHRWPMIADALRYLLSKHGDFQRSPVGQARIRGQIAFALASAGRRREALAEMLAVAKLNPREKRLYAVMPVLIGLISGDRILRFAQRRGRGV